MLFDEKTYTFFRDELEESSPSVIWGTMTKIDVVCRLLT